MSKQKLVTTKEFIQLATIFVIGCALCDFDFNYTTEKECNTIEVNVVTVITEVDTALWNGFRGIGNPDYKMD